VRGLQDLGLCLVEKWEADVEDLAVVVDVGVVSVLAPLAVEREGEGCVEERLGVGGKQVRLQKRGMKRFNSSV
jgi:hypothetical protein